jgi:hypothetical protein
LADGHITFFQSNIQTPVLTTKAIHKTATKLKKRQSTYDKGQDLFVILVFLFKRKKHYPNTIHCQIPCFMTPNTVPTIRQYFQATKATTRTLLQQSGIVFTCCFAIIGIASIFQAHVTPNSITIFILCVVLGNAFGVFISSVSFFSAFFKFRLITKLYYATSIQIRDQFGLILQSVQNNPKYEYPQLKITNSKSEVYLVIDYFEHSKEFAITLKNNFGRARNYSKKMFEIQKKYKKQRISLTAWGLRKTINFKKWSNISHDELNQIINELVHTSSAENLRVCKRIS